MQTLTLTLSPDLDPDPRPRTDPVDKYKAQPGVQEQELAVYVFDSAAAISRCALDHSHDVTDVHLQKHTEPALCSLKDFVGKRFLSSCRFRVCAVCICQSGVVQLPTPDPCLPGGLETGGNF